MLLALTLATAMSISDPCGAFTVHLKSASGIATEDDMTVTLTFDHKTSVDVPVPEALYEPRATLRNVNNLCTRLAAFDAGNDRVLLLLSRNMRPSWDVLDAVLIDTKKKRVLDVRRDVGEIKTEDRVFVVRGSFEVLLIREHIENSGCDCAAAAIEDWLLLTVNGERLETRW